MIFGRNVTHDRIADIDMRRRARKGYAASRIDMHAPLQPACQAIHRAAANRVGEIGNVMRVLAPGERRHMLVRVSRLFRVWPVRDGGPPAGRAAAGRCLRASLRTRLSSLKDRLRHELRNRHRLRRRDDLRHSQRGRQWPRPRHQHRNQ